MKKNTLLCLLVYCTAINGTAQTFNEWFKQAKTQKRYLLQQIAAYQQYLSYLGRGYSIVKDKNKLIGLLKQQDFDQHKDKYARLKNASPAIRNYPVVTAILNLEAAILPIATKASQQASSAIVLSPQEAVYIKKVFDRLLQQCDEITSELIDLLTDGKLGLTDDQRIQRINELYADLQVKYTFTYSFSKESRILQLVRSREAAVIANQKRIHQQP